MKSALIGAGYGFVLLLLSLVIGGAGHGILVPLLISAAPIPVDGIVPVFAFRPEWVTMFLPPLVWSIAAILAHMRQRWLFPITIGVYYVSAAIYSVIAWHDDFNGSYRNLSGMIRFAAPYLVTFGAVYFGGQFWLWRSYAKHRQRLSDSTEPITAR